MGTIRFPRFDANAAVAFSQAELDHAALHQRGRVYGLSGYTWAGVPRPQHGYAFAWVASGGMGNAGFVVLLARSARAAEYLRQGWITWAMDRYELPYAHADALYSAIREARVGGCGHEEPVLDYVLDTLDHPGWGYFDQRLGWRWHERWGMPETGLSFPRLTAAAAIVAAYRPRLARADWRETPPAAVSEGHRQ